MIKAILACDSRGGIAKKGRMPWPHNRQDLAHFKKLTQGNIVVMGRRTWESTDMPVPLPGRTNVVITRDPNFQADGATVISNNLLENLNQIAATGSVFIIGGADLFIQLLDQISILHLTRIAGNYDCDTFLPLDTVAQKFIMIDSVTITHSTTFETHFARTLHDLHIQTVF